MLQRDFPVVAADQVPLQQKTKIPLTKSPIKPVRMSQSYWQSTNVMSYENQKKRNVLVFKGN